MSEEMTTPEVVFRSAELNYEEGAEGKPGVLEGKAVPYGEWTEIRSAIEGHFFERVLPGALKKTFTERAHRMRVLFEHGFSRLLDKQPIASLEEIRDEDDGAYYRAQLLPGLPDLFIEGLKRGLYGTSIALRPPFKIDVDPYPKRSDWNPEGVEERSIQEAAVKEFSVVTFPAYEGATAGVRSITDDFYVARFLEHPDHLLQLVRAQVEPPHSGPAIQEDPEVEEGSRDTLPKPKHDWLSIEGETPKWRIP